MALLWYKYIKQKRLENDNDNLILLQPEHSNRFSNRIRLRDVYKPCINLFVIQNSHKRHLKPKLPFLTRHHIIFFIMKWFYDFYTFCDQTQFKCQTCTFHKPIYTYMYLYRNHCHNLLPIFESKTISIQKYTFYTFIQIENMFLCFCQLSYNEANISMH